MKLSTDRILTTHVGSLPRPEPLGTMLLDRDAGEPVDAATVVLTKLGRSNLWFTDATVEERSKDRRTRTDDQGQGGRVDRHLLGTD